MRLTSQLINGISRVFRKFLKYFNDTIISTSFVLTLVFPVIFILDLNDSESVKLSFGSSLMFLENYQYVLLRYTLTLLYQHF